MEEGHHHASRSNGFTNQNSSPERDEEGSNQRNKKQVTTFFRLFAAADKLDYLLMALASTGSCVHGAAIPVFFVLFDRMIDSLGRFSSDPHKMSAHVSQYALYLFYLGLVVCSSSWMGVAFWMQTGERQTARLRVRYLNAVLQKDIDFFDIDAQEKNLIYHISSDAVLVQDAISEKIGHSLRYLSQFIMGFLISFMAVWKLTLVTMTIVPFMIIAGASYAVVMSTLSKKAEAAYAESGKVAEEVISQIRTVYSFVGEHRAVATYSSSLQKALKFGKKAGLAKGLGIGFTYALMFSAWVLLLWFASILIERHQTTGSKAFTTIMNVIFSGLGLGQAAPNLVAIGKAQAAAANLLILIETDDSSSRRLVSGITLPKIKGEIEFQEVCFKYPTRSKLIFESLSFSVAAGKTFGIVGPSGSGKSTTISLVQRFYDPCAGCVLLDGHDIRSLQLQWLRRQMGLVSQEPALFATTIAENILYGKEDADMKQVVEAAQAANAHSFVQFLPDGYHTQVGEGGTQLSGGQKQRIAIARAVLRNPKILLLDEATSALDAGSEFLVQQALDEIISDRTTLVVAHRLSTIRDVDQIIVLNKGFVVECGTHVELMSKGGEYASLVSSQVSEMGSNQRTESNQLSSEILSFAGCPINDGPLQDLRSTSRGEQNLGQAANKNTDPLPTQTTPSFKELIMLSKPEVPYAVLGSIGAALTGIEAPLLALGITYILTSFYSHDDFTMGHDMKKFAFAFIGMAVIAIPINMMQHYFYTLMGERITIRVRLSMFSAMLSSEAGWFDLEENSVGSLVSKLGADATLVRTLIVDRLSTIVHNTALTVTAFAVAFKFSWRITAVGLSMFPFLVVSCIGEQYFLRGLAGDYFSTYSQATALAREAIANIRTIAAFGAEERISKQFALYLKVLNKQTLLGNHISGLGYGISQLFTFSVYALTLWYASALLKHGYNNFGDIIKSFMILIVTAFAVAEALALTPGIVRGSDALGSIFSIIKRKTVMDPDDPKSTMATDIKGEIEFREVSFQYPTRPDVNVLKGLNLNIPAGYSLAVVGQSGSGKSTLIALVMRFYDPTSGSVLIDGFDIRDLNLKSLRRRISLVLQEPALFSTTIYENIRYGNESATEIEIRKAAKAANAHGFISRMPEGYETQVGEKGSQLSGGQKQRISIARAMLKDPSILLLDEATSALDTTTEKLVQAALEKLMRGRTTVVVAHRLSTIRNADSIAVMYKGKVTEIGHHEELIKTPGSIYAQLVNLQHENKELNEDKVF